jgi:antirestriction protein ArdC
MDTPGLTPEIRRFTKASGAIFATTTDDHASFSMVKDIIFIPDRSAYPSDAAYHWAIFHEMIHWTAKSQGRPLHFTEIDDRYAEEEIIAAIGAAYLCHHFRIDHLDPTVDYISHYVPALPGRSEGEAYKRAMQEANKAADYLIAIYNKV